MQLMDEILSDKTMDRIERIDKLEAILSAATLLPSDPVSSQQWFDLTSEKLMFKFVPGYYNPSKFRHSIELEQFIRQFSIQQNRAKKVSSSVKYLALFAT